MLCPIIQNFLLTLPLPPSHSKNPFKKLNAHACMHVHARTHTQSSMSTLPECPFLEPTSNFNDSFASTFFSFCNKGDWTFDLMHMDKPFTTKRHPQPHHSWGDEIQATLKLPPTWQSSRVTTWFMQIRTLQRMQGMLLIIILIGNYALSRTVSGQLMHTFTYPLEAHTDDGELPTPFKTLSSLGFLNTHSLPRVLPLLSWLQAPECNTVSDFLHVFGSPLLYFIQWQLKPSNVLQLGYHVIVFLYHIP